MLTCLALVAFNVASLGEIPQMTTGIEASARVLGAATEATPDLATRIEAFSADAMQLSASLQQAEVGQDMPCIFQGIARDARDRAAEFTEADTAAERDAVFMNLRLLMDDAVLMAPMAASAAADRAAESDIARR